MTPDHDLANLALGLSGGMGTGKSTLARELASRMDGEIVSFGSYMRHRASLLSLEPTRENLQDLGQDLHDSLGPDTLVELALEWAQPTTTTQIFDGVRHVDVWEAIQRLYARSCLVWLYLPSNQQEQRLQARESQREISIEKWQTHAVESDKTALYHKADMALSAESSVEHLAYRIEAYLSR